MIFEVAHVCIASEKQYPTWYRPSLSPPPPLQPGIPGCFPCRKASYIRVARPTTLAEFLSDFAMMMYFCCNGIFHARKPQQTGSQYFDFVEGLGTESSPKERGLEDANPQTRIRTRSFSVQNPALSPFSPSFPNTVHLTGFAQNFGEIQAT